jgi:UDP-N-acetylglucosamine diphosphorylase/glucosamine-1-phosphate N-acetyltransferase
MKKISYPGELLCILNSWDIFELNDRVLRDDFKRITKGRKSGPVSTSNRVFGDGDLFLEEGAKVEGAIINTVTGPVYIGRNAEIMEGSVIRGPLALCEYASLKMGAKIYGATTLGPYCKAGGEVHNSVFFGYTSKAHDGYLGNAVLGEWCNLGADTNNSNLKNNYALVKLWNYRKEKFMDTGLQFCGLIMGDHSKCGINTMFNTGTVVGVSANIYGAGFPRNFIPSFTWGGPGGVVDYRADIAFETVEIVMARRNKSLTDEDKAILLKVYELTRKYRKK